MGKSLLQVHHVSILRSLEDPEVHKRIVKILLLDLIMRQTVPVHIICFEIHFNIVLSFLSLCFNKSRPPKQRFYYISTCLIMNRTNKMQLHRLIYYS